MDTALLEVDEGVMRLVHFPPRFFWPFWKQDVLNDLSSFRPLPWRSGGRFAFIESTKKSIPCVVHPFFWLWQHFFSLDCRGRRICDLTCLFYRRRCDDFLKETLFYNTSMKMFRNAFVAPLSVQHLDVNYLPGTMILRTVPPRLDVGLWIQTRCTRTVRKGMQDRASSQYITSNVPSFFYRPSFQHFELFGAESFWSFQVNIGESMMIRDEGDFPFRTTAVTWWVQFLRGNFALHIFH